MVKARNKPDGFQYYEMVLCYVDKQHTVIIAQLPRNVDCTHLDLLVEGIKIEEPGMYLGAKLGKMDVDGVHCWTMSAEQYVIASVKNVKDFLAKRGLCLPSKCYTPLATNYHPELEVTPEL